MHYLQAGICEKLGATEINDLQLPGVSPQSLQGGVFHAAAGVHPQHLQAGTACCHSSIAGIGDVQAPAGGAGPAPVRSTAGRHPTTGGLQAAEELMGSCDLTQIVAMCHQQLPYCSYC